MHTHADATLHTPVSQQRTRQPAPQTAASQGCHLQETSRATPIKQPTRHETRLPLQPAEGPTPASLLVHAQQLTRTHTHQGQCLQRMAAHTHTHKLQSCRRGRVRSDPRCGWAGNLNPQHVARTAGGPSECRRPACMRSANAGARSHGTGLRSRPATGAACMYTQMGVHTQEGKHAAKARTLGQIRRRVQQEQGQNGQWLVYSCVTERPGAVQ